VLLVLLLGGGILVARALPPDPADPCATPLAWRVGDIDPRFDLTVPEVRQAVEEAVWVWETAVDRQLFRHDPEADMAVDLVYDARTDTHDRQRQLGVELARIEEDLEFHQASLDRLRARLRADSLAHREQRSAETAARYRASVDRFNRAVDLYNAAVRRHDEARRELEASPSELSVGSLHSEKKTRGGRVTETRRTVSIAYVGSHAELILILTHELGHALGLDHVGADAVMAASYRHDELDYPVRLQPRDIAALERLCHDREE
jgi:hypothetical protein